MELIASSLKDTLNEVIAETTNVYEKMMKLLDGTNQNEDKGWIEELPFNIDTCNIYAKGIFASKKDEAPSEGRKVTSRLNYCQNEDNITEVTTADNPEINKRKVIWPSKRSKLI